MNIVLCGFMGSGKTVVGNELAKITGRRFIDTDLYIEKQQGVSIKAIFAAHGEEYFRELEYNCCKELSNCKNCVISTGGGAVIYERNVKALKQGGKIVFLDADFDTVCKRVGDSSNRPLFQDKENALRLFNERHDIYKNVADCIIDGNMSARKTALQIAELFK